MWLQTFNDEFPGFFDLVQLRRNGEVVYSLIAEIETPLENCELYDFLPRIGEYHAKRGTRIDQIIRSFHIWRRSFVACSKEWIQTDQFQVSLLEVYETFPSVHERIDEMQKRVSALYWAYFETQLNHKDQTIHQLHGDRLNLLGKMAASMAHEIRNPLFAIEGFLKLIRKKLPEDALYQVEGYIDVMESEFKGLYSQITGILSFSKNNILEEPLLPCSLQELITTVVNLTWPRLNADNIELLQDIDQEYTVTVQRIAIQQVLTNLINNSIEAFSDVTSPDKRISISIQSEGQNYCVSVKDNGPGIPDHIRDSIFEPFVTGKQHGTGLGLSICRQIMEKNHGELSFRSKAGETEFVLEFNKVSSISNVS